MNKGKQKAVTTMLATGQRIKALRYALGQNQASFGEMAGVGRTAVTNYESGIRRPDLDEGIRISQATGVPIDWIYKGTLVELLPEHLRRAITIYERQQNEIE